MTKSPSEHGTNCNRMMVGNWSQPADCQRAGDVVFFVYKRETTMAIIWADDGIHGVRHEVILTE